MTTDRKIVLLNSHKTTNGYTVIINAYWYWSNVYQYSTHTFHRQEKTNARMKYRRKNQGLLLSTAVTQAFDKEPERAPELLVWSSSWKGRSKICHFMKRLEPTVLYRPVQCSLTMRNALILFNRQSWISTIRDQLVGDIHLQCLRFVIPRTGPLKIFHQMPVASD